MSALLRMILVWVVCLVPVVVVAWLIRRQRHARLSAKASPFRELRRRPAGETLRFKLGEIDERLDYWTSMLALAPVFVATFAWYFRSATWVALAPMIAVSLACTGIFGRIVYRISCQRENYQLGFDGERFVGEELCRSIARGFEVYHDVPFEDEKPKKKFNIDHVLVGPGGVFSVETKTRRKPVSESKGKEFHVQFDGSCLRWPWGTDAHGLEQAAANARTLSQELTGAVGEPVYVTPILTLPGWMVDRSVPRSTVQVLNPKEILGFVSNAKDHRLSENLIRRICFQLDRKCKLEVE